MSKEFGEKIKKLREAAEFTQQDIADRLNVDRSTYSNYERGVTEPGLKTLKKISRILGADVDALLADDDEFAKVAEHVERPFFNLTKDEKLLLIKYRVLNDDQKKASVDYVSDFEVED